MNAIVTRARKPRKGHWSRPVRRIIGYQPLAAGSSPCLIHTAVTPVGRLPGSGGVIFKQEELH